MALSLSAEQKELLKIFKIEEQYVIPAYQRPYSWSYDHCLQLYNDLMTSYRHEGHKEDYFIGNIIIAKSDESKDVLEVIDGQQRLTTLLLLIKVLSVFQPNLKILDEIIYNIDWTGEKNGFRLKSKIFEVNDEKFLEKVLSYKREDFNKRLNEVKDKKNKFITKKFESKFESNSLYFYDWINFYIKDSNNSIDGFISFLLKNVYLLPIELSGKTQSEANEKALIIFETINNRGMNLEDADIFKAKLYKKSEKLNEESIFIELWGEFKNRSEKLNLEIDDIFRYYSHIIRGKEGISSSEINLRNFFTLQSYSPFQLKRYREIMDDLFKIVEILEFIEIEKNKSSTFSKWLQLINIYTNQYPKIALVTYLFINKIKIDSKLYDFLESLVRYIYYYGSTTRIKFEIYSINKKICSNQLIDNYYREDIDKEYFNYLGSLKYGYALLAYYVDKDISLAFYATKKIINLKDKKKLHELGWSDENIEKILNKLGNFLVVDANMKTNSTLLKDYTYKDLLDRDEQLRDKLVKFFKGCK